MESIIRDVLNGTGSFKDLEKAKTVNSSMFAPQFPERVQEDTNSSLVDSLPKIQVLGVGGAGNNAIDRLMSIGVDAECIAVNTDAQHLISTSSHKKLLIGKEKCRGYGAGNNPSVGELAARESTQDVDAIIKGDMVFITCGLGGGTGTGAAPVIARQAKEKGALTVSVCTLPFGMEGQKRYENARDGLKRLFEASDTVIVVPNEKLLHLSEEITMVAAFKIADEVLVRAVKAITELITKPQLINLDFADVKKILTDGGLALIGLGESDHQHMKVKESVADALKNPLLNDLEIRSAKKALVCVSGGETLSLRDAEEAVMKVVSEIDNTAEIIWGAAIDKDLGNKLRLIVILSDVNSSLTNYNGIYCQNHDLDFLLGDSKSPFSVFNLNSRKKAKSDDSVNFNRENDPENSSKKDKKRFFSFRK